MTYFDLKLKDQTVYKDLDAVAKTHPLILDENGNFTVLRFKPNRAVQLIMEYTNHQLLNRLAIAVQNGQCPESDLRALYRQMGYSLCGYLDVFPGGGR
jgi:hypothetical protein